ncbi:MAG: UDP-N-acetylmuramate--L-alanine ligase [Actinomycetota bacterium]|nr:UDP-N-acetylmuramate--L-alanine ligase [Actinomycetota bacterium]
MRLPVPEDRPGLDDLGRVHFVGIGGAGLSAIARIMLARGVAVSGSDAAVSPVLADLEARGARVFVGHDATHIDDLADTDTLVVSTAVRETNPEVVEARRRGLRLLPRSAGLDAVMQDHRVVAVAGTHGKTTTTSLLTVALLGAGADPSYAIGGELTVSGTNAHQGSGDLFVAEADESDGAFLVYSPHAAVVTNVEADHLDNWGSEQAYFEAFVQFLDRVDPDGFLVCCVDDDGARRLADVARSRGLRVVGVGQSDDADVQVRDVAFAAATSTFDVLRYGERAGRVRLQIPGMHYVLDAACALAAALELGHDFAALRDGLQGFTGTRRRMELKGTSGGVRVYDSYAHHPTEIRADILAGRMLAGEGRLVVCFQPHMFSRTRIFATQMAAALALADRVVVMDVYPAREEPEPGVDGALVARQVPAGPAEVVFEPDRDEVVPRLAAMAGAGDVVLTLGAGDITHLGPHLLSALEGR